MKKRDELEALGASVVGISVDPAEDSKTLDEEMKLGIPLLSDADLKVIEAYGLRMARRDIAVPAVYVVGPDGVVAFSYVGENVKDRPSADRIVAEVKKLR